MVGVREMRMTMRYGLMPMGMGVASACGNGWLMLMVVMQVAIAMDMLVLMLHRLVKMLVLMPLAQVQGDTDGHQQPCQQQLPSP